MVKPSDPTSMSTEQVAEERSCRFMNSLLHHPEYPETAGSSVFVKDSKTKLDKALDNAESVFFSIS